MATLAPFLALGFGGSLGTAHADGWNHVVRGLYVWEHEWGDSGPMPVVFQYATHLNGTRWGASSLLAGLSIFTDFGNPASALTLFFLLTAAATFVGFWELGNELFSDWRLALLFAAFSGAISWTPHILSAGNYENSLFNVYPPILCAIFLSIRRRVPGIHDACLAALCAAAAFAGYPEGTAIVAVLLSPFAIFSVCSGESRAAVARFWVPFCALSLLLSAPAITRFITLVLRQMSYAATVQAGATLRPGEGLFPGVLSAHAPAAFFTFGATVTANTWLLLALSFLLIPVVIGLGLRPLCRANRAWIAAMGLLVIFGVAFGFASKYDYGLYKVANVGAFVSVSVVFSGLAALFGVGPSAGPSRFPNARILLLSTAVFAVGVAKHVQDPLFKLVPSSRYTSLLRDPRLLEAGGVALRLESPVDQLWATYYLRQVPLVADTWRSYLGQRHVLPVIARAEKPRPGSMLYLLNAPVGEGEVSSHSLQFAEEPPLRLLRIDNPNGLERSADGRRFIWLGHKAVRLVLESPTAGPADLRWDRLTIGPNAPGVRSLKLNVTDARGTRDVTVTADDFRLHLSVGQGTQEIVIHCATPPTPVAHPNGDQRVLMLGLLSPRIERP